MARFVPWDPEQSSGSPSGSTSKPVLIPGSWRILGSWGHGIRVMDPGYPGSWGQDPGVRGSWDPGVRILGPGVKDPGSRILGHGSWVQDPGSWDPGSWDPGIQDPGSMARRAMEGPLDPSAIQTPIRSTSWDRVPRSQDVAPPWACLVPRHAQGTLR